MQDELRERLEEIKELEREIHPDPEAFRRWSDRITNRHAAAFHDLVSEVSRLEAENERLKTRIAEVEAGDDWKELVRPVHRCGFVHPSDGTCFHPGAMTPECHLGVICPIVESTKTPKEG